MILFTHTTSSDKEWSKLCIESQKEYAKIHNLEHYVYEDLETFGRSVEWSRFRSMQGWMSMVAPNNEIGVWMDSDLMIMNMEFDLKKLLNNFKEDDSAKVGYIFSDTSSLDLGLVFLKYSAGGQSLFEYGWRIGKVESNGLRKDKLSFDLMFNIKPEAFKINSTLGILSNWYPIGPFNFYNQHINMAHGKEGLLSIKKPREVLEGFNNLYIPGSFAIHFKTKGSELLDISTNFKKYRELLQKDIVDSREMMKELKSIE